ncbi:uncharacterized [Tachysurus ichikawai]
MRRIESPELSDCHLQLASLSFIQQHQVIKFALGRCGTLETLAHTYDRWTEIAGAAAGSEPGIIRACDGYECVSTGEGPRPSPERPRWQREV